jgi:hypothetical protein
MGADLNNIVRTQKLSDDHVQFLIYQILRGLKYIHSAGIIHRVRTTMCVIPNRFTDEFYSKNVVMKGFLNILAKFWKPIFIGFHSLL